jgi:hypothetical protein
MLKSFSALANGIGALNYKGTWDATANSPALASGVGTKGDYYVVSVAGSTTLDGISNWGIGDWAVFNGSVWQRVEGGADVNAVNLTVSGNTTLSGPVSITPTWNAGATVFTGIGMNVTDTASASNSALLDLQVGGSSKFNVSKSGALTLSSAVWPTYLRLDDGFGANGVHLYRAGTGLLTLYNTAENDFNRLQFGGTTNSFPAIARDGAGISIVGGAAGSTAHIKVPGVTVANLPAAATAGAGARSFVTDALAPVFGSAVVGGGAVNVPVYSTGAAWNVG